MTLTVIAPAAETRLTTVAAVKAELQITSGADDAYLATLIDQASAAVGSWCRRVLAAEAVSETFHTDKPALSLMLARYPIVTIDSALSNSDAINPDRLDVEDGGFVYRLNDAGDRVTWPTGRIVIAYRAGFVMPGQPGRTLPSDIERAALSLVKVGWFARTRDPLVRSETIDGAGKTDYFSGTVSLLPPDVEALLFPYRNVNLG